MRGSDGMLCFSKKGRGYVLKDYMIDIMNEENDFNHNVDGDAVVGPVICVGREEVLGGIHVMVDICQSVLDRFEFQVSGL